MLLAMSIERRNVAMKKNEVCSEKNFMQENKKKKKNIKEVGWYL
jgi:hypothetical protein